MPITEKQRIERQSHIGSSDVAAMLNLDPNRTASSVYFEKTCTLDEMKSNDAIDLGNFLEGGVLDLAAARLGLAITHNRRFESKENPLHASNLDAKIVDRPGAIEAKVVGILSDFIDTVDMWGKEDTDNSVPHHVQLQVQHQMYSAELEFVYVAALIRGRGLCVFRVLRNPEVIDIVVERTEDWWSKYIVPKQMPTDSIPDLDVLKRVRRMAETVTTIEPSLEAEYDAAKVALDEAQARYDKGKGAILAHMGQSEAADWGDPKKVFTYLEQSQTTINADRLRAQHPEIAKEFSKTSTFRVLRKSNRSKVNGYSEGI